MRSGNRNPGRATSKLGVIVVMVLASGCGGCGEKKKNHSTKQTSIPEIVKKYKDDPQQLAENLIITAKKAQKAKDAPRAKEAIEAAVKAADKISGSEQRAAIFTNLASAEYYLGDESAAKKSIGKALDEIDKLADKAEVQADYMLKLASMVAKNKQPDQARGHLASAEEIVEKIEVPDGKIFVLSQVAAVYAKIDDKDEAQRVVADAKKVADSLEDKSLPKAVALARIAAAQHAFDRAAANNAFDAAAKVAESIETDFVQVNAMFQIAELMYQAGEKASAQKLLIKTKELAVKVKDLGQRNEVVRKIDELFKKIETPSK
jgi:tetratricopeptide (TPR) repeat protein